MFIDSYNKLVFMQLSLVRGWIKIFFKVFVLIYFSYFIHGAKTLIELSPIVSGKRKNVSDCCSFKILLNQSKFPCDCFYHQYVIVIKVPNQNKVAPK